MYFCCKLFNSKGSTSQLANERTNDCKNLSFKLKTHETTKEHIPNMNAWLDLEIRILKKKKKHETEFETSFKINR